MLPGRVARTKEEEAEMAKAMSKGVFRVFRVFVRGALVGARGDGAEGRGGFVAPLRRGAREAAG
jgi:hypothetical protein